MERQYRIRLEELRADAVVAPRVVRGVTQRLDLSLQPFVASLRTAEQKVNETQYVTGLVSDLDSKDTESIAYLHGRERQGFQKFLGQSEWDHRPFVREVGQELSEADGVLVFDPSAFANKGTESGGGQHQWCGRLGKVDNCQVGIYLGYVCRREHALVDFRL